MEYDESVIREFAARLYKKAKSIALMYGFLFALIGAGIGATFGDVVGAGIGLIIGAIMGYAIGTERGFSLRLQAQTALCQVQIEKNTRIE